MPNQRKKSVFDMISESVDEMREMVEELFQTGSPSWDVHTSTIRPLCDISVTSDEVIVTADLPFSEPDSVKVRPVDKRTLRITAKMKRRMCCEELGITHQKGEFANFDCQKSIPVPVEMEKRSVQFKKGILEVRLPRKKGYEIKVE